jgi:hypothetical protein
LSPLKPADLAPLKSQALNAFNRILDDFLNDRFDQLVLSLADNGKPIVPVGKQNKKTIARAMEKLKRDLNGGDLQKTKALVNDLKPRTAVHGEPEGEVRLDGTIVIRIPCVGSESVKNKHIPRHDNTKHTIDDQGRVNIYMLKQDGHWYWNPFGW